MIKRKKSQELTIKDNFMFGAVMVDEDLCKVFLELVLGFQIAKVTVSREKSFFYHPEYKGVRLDIVAADERQTHYNIEMQVQRKMNLEKRSRYYHSQIDMELLLTGMEYAQLPDSYVIFICDFDPFGKRKYQYTFDMVCREDGKVALEGGNHTVFLSTHGKNEDEVPKGLVKFLKYVKAELDESTEDFEDDFVRRLQDAVRNIKANRKMEERYMLLEELIKEERELGRAEGKVEGKAEGKAESILDLLSELGKVPEEVQKKVMGVPEEVQKKVMGEKNPAVLKSYLKKASVAETIEDFMRTIEQL